MTPLKRLEAYRQLAIVVHKYPKNSRLVVEESGTYLEAIDESSFCCGTTLREDRIKLK